MKPIRGTAWSKAGALGNLGPRIRICSRVVYTRMSTSHLAVYHVKVEALGWLDPCSRGFARHMKTQSFGFCSELKQVCKSRKGRRKQSDC
jgi:hypothetical protein